MTLYALAEEARGIARAELSEPGLYSVLVEFAKGGSPPVPSRFQFGFQQLERGLLWGAQLKVCWVELVVASRSMKLGSVGTYGQRQFEQLSTMAGFTFPPPVIDLREGQLEAEDAWRMLQTTSPFGSNMGQVALSVCVHEGRPAWRGLQDVPGSGFRTVFMDAADGRVLYQKVDREVRPTAGS